MMAASSAPHQLLPWMRKCFGTRLPSIDTKAKKTRSAESTWARRSHLCRGANSSSSGLVWRPVTRGREISPIGTDPKKHADNTWKAVRKYVEGAGRRFAVPETHPSRRTHRVDMTSILIRWSASRWLSGISTT